MKMVLMKVELIFASVLFSPEGNFSSCDNVVKALGRRSGTVGDGNLSIVVLTYNVWFREDLELTARMNAIGGIICEHNPHFVCLQVCMLSFIIGLLYFCHL